MNPLRVGYVIRDFRLGGGTENHLMQVFDRLDRSRFEPSLFLLREHGELIDDVRAKGIPVFIAHMNGSLVSPSLPGCIARVARLFRRQKVDIVHTYLPRGELVGAVAGRLAGVPVVVCSKRGCHYRRGAEAVGARISNRLADCVLANAKAVKGFVAADESCPPGKIEVIENGVDTRRFVPVATAGPYKGRLGIEPDALVVGTITRARVRKGYEEFLRASAAVSRAYPDLQVVVVGQDTREQVPHALVRELGIESRLHLLGLRTDVPDVLAALDVFVLSSHDEGMSNAIMEAMSVGKPVVATDVGGAIEMLTHMRSGLLVPPKEVPPLATAIQYMFDHPAEAAEMGRKARATIEKRFALEVMVKRMEDLYARLWESKRSAAGAVARPAA